MPPFFEIDGEGAEEKKKNKNKNKERTRTSGRRGSEAGEAARGGLLTLYFLLRPRGG